MEPFISLEDVANIVTFIVPGYFVIQVYSFIYAKRDRDFSRLLIESVVYSLPMLTVVNIIWLNIFRQSQVSTVNVGYALLILAVSLAVGFVVAALRDRWPVKNFIEKFGIGSPHDDFVKAQFLRIKFDDAKQNAVTVKLKSGATFSGTPSRISRFSHGSPSYYYFLNLAWFNEGTNKWEVRGGGVIVGGDEIEYIQTGQLRD